MTVTLGQLRAARGLLGWSQEMLAEKSGVGRATIADFEAGKRTPYDRTVATLRAALKSAGVEFTNGGQPGVRLKMREDTHSDLKQQINHMQARVDFDEPRGPVSPKRGMQQLRGAKAKNELVKLKNRRAKLKRHEKK